MRQLANFVSYTPIDEQRLLEINNIISTKVTPAISELETKIKISRKKWPKRLLDKTTSISTTATLISTVYAGIPLNYGLLAASGLIGIQTALDTYYESKDLRAVNGFSFFMELKKK